MSLSEIQHTRLKSEVLDALESISWPGVIAGETEPHYTARVVFPPLRGLQQKLGHPGLSIRSDGFETPEYVTLGNLTFVPDISFSHDHQREIAIECKFVMLGNTNNQLSTAIGQATLYKSLGYKSSIVLLIEKDSRTGYLSAFDIESLGVALGIQFVIARTPGK